eukprot:jgi/Picre1/32816/NNA_008146.t1
MDSLNTLLIQRTKDLEHTELLLSNAKSAVESVTEKSALNASDFESHTSTIVDDLEKMKERAEKAERDAAKLRNFKYMQLLQQNKQPIPGCCETGTGRPQGVVEGRVRPSRCSF